LQFKLQVNTANPKQINVINDQNITRADVTGLSDEGFILKLDRYRLTTIFGYIQSNESFSFNEDLEVKNDANDSQEQIPREGPNAVDYSGGAGVN
jgi:hypothetical protein